MARRQRAHNPTKATSPKPSEVEVRNVAHPRVWATAIHLAGGEKDRIVVESFGKVSVQVKEAPPSEVNDD